LNPPLRKKSKGLKPPPKKKKQGVETPCCLLYWELKLSFFILREVAGSIAFLDPANSLRFVQDYDISSNSSNNDHAFAKRHLEIGGAGSRLSSG